MYKIFKFKFVIFAFVFILTLFTLNFCIGKKLPMVGSDLFLYFNFI